MKKAELDGRLYNVCDMNDFTDNPELYNPRFTAIQRDNVVLPVHTKVGETGPGIYYQDGSMVSMVVKPNDPAEYSADKIVDFSNPQSIGELIGKQNLIKNIQDEIMTTAENVLCLKISEKCTPEMRALKTAINSKRIDPKMYEDRFDQFQNDMRLLKGDSITLAKLVSISEALDISCDLTLRDRDENTPNPMNQVIKLDLTEGR